MCQNAALQSLRNGMVCLRDEVHRTLIEEVYRCVVSVNGTRNVGSEHCIPLYIFGSFALPRRLMSSIVWTSGSHDAPRFAILGSSDVSGLELMFEAHWSYKKHKVKGTEWVDMVEIDT